MASLLWNLVNSYYTRRTATTLRNEGYRLAQWNRLRTRIDDSLHLLSEAAKTMARQVRELDNDNLNAGFAMLNQILIDAQDDLASALEEADKSIYCEGKHWLSAANGPTTGTETAWDLVLAKLEEARDAKTKAAKLKLLGEIKQPIKSISELVHEHCRVQDIRLDPSRI